jgi:hypothetical protein
VARRPLRKKLTYRDRTGRDAAFHAEHWKDFVWEAGPWIVAATGPWGTMQVWAATQQEGRRVLAHAAVAGGWDLSQPGVQWNTCYATGGRNGKPGRMRVKRSPLGMEVTKRAGPSGFPSLA